MDLTTVFGFAGAFTQNLADFSLYIALGIVAGGAFPLALVCKRSLQRTGHFLGAAERRRHRARHGAVLVCCLAAPWLVLFLGRLLDGAQVASFHLLVLIVSSMVTMGFLLRHWRLVSRRPSAE